LKNGGVHGAECGGIHTPHIVEFYYQAKKFMQFTYRKAHLRRERDLKPLAVLGGSFFEERMFSIAS
jgi:hypothetical protein